MGISLRNNLRGVRRAQDEGIIFTEKKGSMKIGIVNLMPFKDEVEYQFFRVLGQYEEDIEVEFLYPRSHTSKNSSMEYIRENYLPLSSVFQRDYDGIIVTGAPVENLPFEEVTYWRELDDFFKSNDLPSIYICWGAQGALYSKHRVEKHPLPEKLFGIYEHTSLTNPFFREVFTAPHSRNTYNRRECIEEKGLRVLSISEKAGVYSCSTEDYRHIYISGHGEYQRYRLKYEYERDGGNLPENYFPGDDPDTEPEGSWEPHTRLFYRRWLDFIRRDA